MRNQSEVGVEIVVHAIGVERGLSVAEVVVSSAPGISSLMAYRDELANVGQPVVILLLLATGCHHGVLCLHACIMMFKGH